MAEIAISAGCFWETDEALVLAAREGDREAFGRLIERHRDLMYAYAASVLQNREDAEDVVQEAFVRAFTALDRFRPGASWGAWQMRITQNLCRDALRRRAARKPAEQGGELSDHSPTPEQRAIEIEGHRILSRHVRSMPEKFRVPLLLRYAYQRSYKEIALALGLPESTVVGRLAGGLRILRRRMNGLEL